MTTFRSFGRQNQVDVLVVVEGKKERINFRYSFAVINVPLVCLDYYYGDVMICKQLFFKIKFGLSK
jgi:hypothetical protein